MTNIYKLLSFGLILAAGSSQAYAEDYEKIGLVCSDGITINGTNPGWNPSAPYVINRSDDGKFRFTVRYGIGNQTWMMFTNGIEPADGSAQGASAIIPNFRAAFDTPPTEMECGNIFPIKYLAEVVGKAVPMSVAGSQGFQVLECHGQPMTYHFVIPADLSTMTIESIDYPEALYLYGDATPGGWDAAQATAMQNLGNGIYRYVGELKAGSPGALQIYAENPAVCTTDAQALGPNSPVEISSSGVANPTFNYYVTRHGDCYYKVTETKKYVLTLNLVTSTINAYIDELDFDKLYIVGTPTRVGNDWTFVEMENEGNGVFSYKGHFDKPDGNAGTFTFSSTNAWNNNTIAPANGDASFGLTPFSDNTLQHQSPYTMHNTCDGYYIVKVDLPSKTVSTRTYNPDPINKLYVLNNGTYHEMVIEPGTTDTYCYSGTLSGDFTVTTTNSAAYPCYMPTIETVEVPGDGLANNETVFNTTADNNVNNKWNIPSSGIYTVRFNPSAMTLGVDNGSTTGISNVSLDNVNAPATYFDLTGRKVENPGCGIYIRVQGEQAQKLVLH